MSLKYDEYLQQHKDAVYEAFLWMKQNIPSIFGGEDIISKIDYNIKIGHDASKKYPDEYGPYDRYFYGNNRSAEVVEDFNYAWLTHIHRNQHHWQHWVLIKDDPNEKVECLKMPDEYVIEMICDWWSFSWNKGNLWEIFDWYDERKEHIMLNNETRRQVENILASMKNKLEEIKESHDETANIPDNN